MINKDNDLLCVIREQANTILDQDDIISSYRWSFLGCVFVIGILIICLILK